MERYYTVSEIAHGLSANGRNYIVTEDSVYKWIQQGRMLVERIPRYIRGFGKYPYWVEREPLKNLLVEMGYDTDWLFTKFE